MIKNFTTTEIISFLYDETDPKTSYLINETLSNDWKALDEFNHFKKAKNLLEPISLTPSTSAIKNILLEASW